jgi:hypothetical protein
MTDPAPEIIHVPLACDFCAAPDRPMFPTEHGPICCDCVRVAVEIVMDQMVRRPSKKHVDTGDNMGTKRKLAA